MRAPLVATLLLLAGPALADATVPTVGGAGDGCPLPPIAQTNSIATNDAIAREHFQRGTTAYDLGQWDRAVDEFGRAWAAHPLPQLVFNLAQAERQRGDRPAAIACYERYLHDAPTSPLRDEVAQKLAQLRAPPPPDAARFPPAPPPDLPYRLERVDIAIGLRSVADAVRRCARPGAASRIARVTVTIVRPGTVAEARVADDVLAGGEARCVEAAVRTARFRTFTGPPIAVTYPYQVP